MAIEVIEVGRDNRHRCLLEMINLQADRNQRVNGCGRDFFFGVFDGGGNYGGWGQDILR
jgi:hypothetical protein